MPRKSPGLTLAAIAMPAVAIGVNVAAFGVVVAGAAALSQLLRQQFYGISHPDPADPQRAPRYE